MAFRDHEPAAEPHTSQETELPSPLDSTREEDELRVLILAPTGRDAVLAAEALRRAGESVGIFPSMEELTRTFLSCGAGAALIAQEALTPPALDELGRALSRQPPWSDLPLILLTSGGRTTEAGETALMQASERLGNATLLERPLRIATLVRAVRVAIRARSRQYEIRGYLQERERTATERMALAEQQRVFLRDVLSSVTEGRLRLCDTPADLPLRLTPFSEPILLGRTALSWLRRETQRAAQMVQMEGERTSDLLTAVNEAGMNAIVHAGGGVATVYVNLPTRTVQIWVEDQGRGIDMSRLPRATLERGYSSAGTFGHGFWLMLTTTDRTFLLTGPNGTTVVIEQECSRPEPAWMRAFPHR